MSRVHLHTEPVSPEGVGSDAQSAAGFRSEAAERLPALFTLRATDSAVASLRSDHHQLC
ncbi:hypothetical protein LDENG_00244490 [Lucifuga dentata]|nr:hypothetical protein LDENG_00244490 [Lucifuga dentata]